MESTAVPSPPDPTPLKAQGLAVIERAQAITITTNEEFEVAGAELRRVASLKRAIEDAFAPAKKAAYDAHKKITALEAALLEYPKTAEALIKQAISRFDMEQARIRRIREAEAQAEAKRRQDAAAMEEAEALQAAGDQRGAEQVIEEAAAAPAPVIELARPMAAGISTRKSFTYRIVDASKIDRRFLIPDEVSIRKLVRAMGPDAAAIVGGIEVIEERIVSARAAG
jgi:hypothetical protein